MRKLEYSKQTLMGACGALTWMLLSACEPVAVAENQPPEELTSTQARLEQNPASGADDEEPVPTGRSWYVSMKGDDNAHGTIDAPLRTIGRATAMARPGDVVHVLTGVYAEQLILESRGEGAEPITLRGEGTVRPTLMPSTREPGAVIFVRGRWNLKNLHVDVDGAPMAAVVFLEGADQSRLSHSELRDGRAGAGVIVQSARRVRIQDNVIHHFIKDRDDSHGVVVVGPAQDTVVRRNVIHHNSGDSVQCQAGTGPAQQLLVENNEFYDNGENGVDIKQCYDVTIRNNVMAGFPNPDIRPPGTSAGEAVLISRGARNIVIQGNSISRAGRGISVLSQVAAPDGIVIDGNTIDQIRNFPHHNGQGIRIAGGRNVQVVNNIVGETASWGLMLAADGNMVPWLTVRNNRVRGGPQQMLVRLGRDSFRPGFSMTENRYTRGGALSMDGVQDRFKGPFAGVRHLFGGENLPLSNETRLELWRRLVGLDEGSELTD